MNNRGLLVVIVVLLVGIFSVMAFQYQKREKPLDERIGDSISEVAEEVGDEIDDNTDAR
jgi:hypothetical protein